MGALEFGEWHGKLHDRHIEALKPHMEELSAIAAAAAEEAA
jgi:hypothetical protein